MTIPEKIRLLLIWGYSKRGKITGFLLSQSSFTDSYKKIMADMMEGLEEVLKNHVEGFQELISCDQLSEGASLETFKIVIRTKRGERKLALRRPPGGIPKSFQDSGPGLRTEALLMQAAKKAGVPEPEIFVISGPEDPLGEAILMEWLEGMSKDYPGLADHLRTTVINQVAIDQPRYSGYQTALKTLKNILVPAELLENGTPA